jgi:hypothetical protein
VALIETKDGEQDDLECDSGNAIASVDLGDPRIETWSMSTVES